MGWIDDLTGIQVQDDGVDVGQRKTINFVGADVSEDVTNDRIDVYVGGVGDWKESARLCPAAALPAYTRTDSEIIANINGALPNLDGVAPALDDVVLLVGVATASDVDNGLWVITSLGAAAAKWSMVRAPLANETGEITPQMTVRVEQGTVNAGRMFVVDTVGTITLNTTPISIVDSASTGLVTSAVAGTVNTLGAGSINRVLQNTTSAGVYTAGGTWNADVSLGATPSTTGRIRLTDGDTIAWRDTSVPADQGVITCTNGNVGIGGRADVGIWVNSVIGFNVSTTAIDFARSNVWFRADVASPVLAQYDDTVAGSTGDTFTIHGQNCTGGGASVGARTELRSGTGATDGEVALYRGAAVAIATTSATNLKFGAGFQYVFWPSNVVGDVWTHIEQTASAGATGRRLILSAQSVSDPAGGASCTDLQIYGGSALVHAGNKTGNVAIGVIACANWQAMENGIYISNAIAPTGNPANGGFMYSNAGAGTWRGSGGTVTAFGPAGQHCPECGYDFAKLSSVNEEWGAYYWECAMCGHVEKSGPQSVLDLLTEDQKLDKLKPGDHVHNMRVMTGRNRPRVRRHDGMLREYERAQESALADCNSTDQADLDAALSVVRAEWAPKWLTWEQSCEELTPDSTIGLGALKSAAEAKAAARVPEQRAKNEERAVKLAAEEAKRGKP
jgi:Zn ribbon nucleic-acid-binding protein